MSDLQDAKRVVRTHYDAMRGATPENVARIIAASTGADYHWRGMHPFHEQAGAKAVAETFWAPFLTAMSRVQRREMYSLPGAIRSMDSRQSGPRRWVI